MIERLFPRLLLVSLALFAGPVSAGEKLAEGVLIADDALDRMTAGFVFVDSFADARAFGPSAHTFTSNFVQGYSLPNFQFGSVNSSAWGLGQIVQVQAAANATVGSAPTASYSGVPVSASAISNVYIFIFGANR